LFAYNLPDGLPASSRTVWSQLPLQPLTAGPLTPFSHSVIDEVAKSAWYQYFDELGFAPMPRSQVLRQSQGRVYLNLTLSAQRDAEAAAVEPLTLMINGKPFALAKWEKPGFLANITTGRSRKKIEHVIETYRQQMADVTQKAAAWYGKTQELRWSQADILQVMEEIERVSIPSFKIFFAVRHNLERVYNRLLWTLEAKQPFPASLALVNHALGDLDQLFEYRMAEQLLALGALAASDKATIAWLESQNYENWQTTLPNQPFIAAMEHFLQQYGHRSLAEGEVRSARWQQEPALLFASLLAYTQQPPTRPAPIPGAAKLQPLLDAVAPDQRKAVQQQVQQIRQLLLLQSQALHAYAYILAGTQRWALAAAKEAAVDKRMRQTDDVFFFQLEEVKQMMTGEWNISSLQAIHDTCDQRKTEFMGWQQEFAPTLLIGNSVADPVHHGLPGARGEATGPLHCCEKPMPGIDHHAIIGTPQLDSGWAFVLPFARALVSATGTPLDPIVAAAHAWQIPTVLALGPQYGKLVASAQTTVHGDTGQVEQ